MNGWDLNRYKWTEVFIEESTPYFLVLAFKVDGDLDVYDPVEGKVVFSCSFYEEACLWLNEDEFIRVDGRMEVTQ